MEKNRTVEEACQLLSSLDVQLASEQVSLFGAGPVLFQRAGPDCWAGRAAGDDGVCEQLLPLCV